MDGLDCPSCGSDDVMGERGSGGTITLTCQSCQTTWDRVPKPSCPKCGRSDVEEYGAQAWAYDDPTAAEGNPAAAQHPEGGRTFRCRGCHNTWGQAR